MKKITDFLTKVLIFVFLVIIIIWFLQDKLNKKTTVNKPETSIDTILLENIPTEKANIETIFDYSSESSNDYLDFNIGKVNFNLKRNEDFPYETLLTVGDSTKSAVRKKNSGYVTSINKLLFNKYNLVLINYYTGGAHCCMVMVPYLVVDNEVSEGTYLYLGNIDVFDKGNFFIKDNKLFAQTYDDRFAYFESDFASSGSMFFPTFYELSFNSFGFINRNDLFVDLYSKLYLQSQKDAKKIINQQNCSKDEISKYEIFGSLVYRYSLGYFAGITREALKSELASDWWCFSEKDMNKIEGDIYKALTKDNKSEDFYRDTLLDSFNKVKD